MSKTDKEYERIMRESREKQRLANEKKAAQGIDPGIDQRIKSTGLSIKPFVSMTKEFAAVIEAFSKMGYPSRYTGKALEKILVSPLDKIHRDAGANVVSQADNVRLEKIITDADPQIKLDEISASAKALQIRLNKAIRDEKDKVSLEECETEAFHDVMKKVFPRDSTGRQNPRRTMMENQIFEEIISINEKFRNQCKAQSKPVETQFLIAIKKTIAPRLQAQFGDNEKIEDLHFCDCLGTPADRYFGTDFLLSIKTTSGRRYYIRFDLTIDPKKQSEGNENRIVLNLRKFEDVRYDEALLLSLINSQRDPAVAKNGIIPGYSDRLELMFSNIADMFEAEILRTQKAGAPKIKPIEPVRSEKAA